jgi:hypothetical protein
MLFHSFSATVANQLNEFSNKGTGQQTETRPDFTLLQPRLPGNPTISGMNYPSFSIIIH